MLNCVKLLKKICISFKVVFRRFKVCFFSLAYKYIKNFRNYNTSKIDFFLLKN